MATKPIIQIDVNDDKFKDFQKAFDRYRKQLTSMPKSWAETGKLTGEAAEFVAGMTAAMKSQNDLLAKRSKDPAFKKAQENHKVELKREKAIREETERRQKATKKMAEDTKAIAKSVVEATSGLLKWVGVGGILGTLVGLGGSLFGLRDLAEGAYDLKKTSSGFGINPGQLQASRIAFGQYTNPEANLAGLTGAQTDPSKAWIFGAMGVNRNQDVLQMQEDFFEKTVALMRRTPLGAIHPIAEARGLYEAGYTDQDLRQMHGLSAGDLAQHKVDFAKSARVLQLTNDTAAGFAHFAVTLKMAEATVEDAFMNRLKKMAPALDSITGTLTAALVKLINSKGFGNLVDELVVGIENLSKWLAGPTFQSDVETFVKDFGLICQKIADGLIYLGVIPDNRPVAKPGSGVDNPNPFAPRNIARLQRSWHDTTSAVGGFFGGIKAPDVSGGLGVGIGNPAMMIPLLGLGGTAALWAESAGGKINAFLHDKGMGARGMAQWRGQRILDFRAHEGVDPLNATQAQQYDFIAYELSHKYKSVAMAMAKAKNEIERARIFIHGYEAPKARGEAHDLMLAKMYMANGFHTPSRHHHGTHIKITNQTGGSAQATVAPLAVGG